MVELKLSGLRYFRSTSGTGAANAEAPTREVKRKDSGNWDNSLIYGFVAVVACAQ